MLGLGTSLVIPGLGLIIAGPLAAGLAGAGAGGITGGLIGALVGSGIPEDRAKIYEDGKLNGTMEATTPKATFSVLHSTPRLTSIISPCISCEKEIVEAICDHPDIEAVSFVGSTKVAKIVYQRATANLKRCLALGGAKNHLLVLPDANPEMTAANVTASMSGCAGQR